MKFGGKTVLLAGLCLLGLCVGALIPPARATTPSGVRVNNWCVEMSCTGDVAGVDPAFLPPKPVTCTLIPTVAFLGCEPNPDNDCLIVPNMSTECKGAYLVGEFPVERFVPCTATFFQCDGNVGHATTTVGGQ